MNRGICIKCQHDEIIVGTPSEFVGDTMEYRMAVTYDPRWLLSSKNPRHGHGQFVSLTCRQCGYTEWWAENPRDIPLGPKNATRLLGAPTHKEAAGRISVARDAGGELTPMEQPGVLSESD